jgi:hypothetical protein
MVLINLCPMLRYNLVENDIHDRMVVLH